MKAGEIFGGPPVGYLWCWWERLAQKENFVNSPGQALLEILPKNKEGNINTEIIPAFHEALTNGSSVEEAFLLACNAEMTILARGIKNLRKQKRATST